jgi:hypothetical protein
MKLLQEPYYSFFSTILKVQFFQLLEFQVYRGKRKQKICPS